MSYMKFCEVGFVVKVIVELFKGLDDLCDVWKCDFVFVLKGLFCFELKEGQFVLVVFELVFVMLLGVCVIKGIGVIELVGLMLVFEEGVYLKLLIFKVMLDGWVFLVKFVLLIICERNFK